MNAAREAAPVREAIVVLGGANARDGTLSTRAIERCRRALEEFARRPVARIVTTGGHGAHFNTAPLPHAEYLRRFLVRHGMPEAAFLGCVESRNTIEDARLTRDAISDRALEHLVVVTSDFHMPRARWIFERTFPSLRLTFAASRTHVSEAEMAALRSRERLALQRVRAAWPVAQPGQGRPVNAPSRSTGASEPCHDSQAPRPGGVAPSFVERSPGGPADLPPAP